MRNLTFYESITFDNQLLEIEALNQNPSYSNPLWSDWHIADSNEMDSLFSNSFENIGALFEPTTPWFTIPDEGEQIEWIGRTATLSDTGNHVNEILILKVFQDGDYWSRAQQTVNYDDNIEYWPVGAWVTADAQPDSPPDPVPEPANISAIVLLLLSR